MLVFANGQQLSTELNREYLLPKHSYIHFPSNHPEVRGYLIAFVEDVVELVERNEVEDSWLLRLTPRFEIDADTFLRDQESVGRFKWKFMSHEE